MVIVLLLLPTASAAAGVPTGFGWLYYIAVLAVAALLICEHGLVRPDDLTRLNMAFFQVNAIVSFGLLVVGCLDLLI